MNKVLLEKLDETFTENNYLLLVGLGFDQRCMSVIEHFPKERATQIVGISNAAWNELNLTSLENFKKLAGSNSQIIGSNASSVIDIADKLRNFLESTNSDESSILLDISSLSHELLVVIVGMLKDLNILNNVSILYVEAASYSFNTPDDAVWLSRGVRSIRSILGFPGTMLPSKKLHLIVLAGFEVERAKETIAQYEPSSLSIGLGHREESISDAHHHKNQHFFDKLHKFIKEQDIYNHEIQHFEFSCINPLTTKKQLLEHIDSLKLSSDKNIVICPLNTKLSTVGVVLAALERPEIQICYSEPEEYNSEGYSLPGKEVSIIQL